MDQDTKDAIESAAKGFAKVISEPAKAAIEQIGKGIAGISEPWLIQRRAKAEARALLTKTDAHIESARRIEIGRIEIDSIRDRALKQKELQAERQQQNLEDIAYQTLQLLPPKVSDQTVDEDWMAFFVDQCQDVSNEMMQSVWSKILANELAAPGAFSRRSLSIVKLMSFEEAQAFTELCSFAWWIDGTPDLIVERPYVYEHEEDLENLAATGLITLDTIRWNSRPIEDPTIRARYFDRQRILTPPAKLTVLELGFVGLTYVGRELLPIAGAARNESYFHDRLRDWREAGFEVELDDFWPNDE